MDVRATVHEEVPQVVTVVGLGRVTVSDQVMRQVSHEEMGLGLGVMVNEDYHRVDQAIRSSTGGVHPVPNAVATNCPGVESVRGFKLVITYFVSSGFFTYPRSMVVEVEGIPSGHVHRAVESFFNVYGEAHSRVARFSSEIVLDVFEGSG